MILTFESKIFLNFHTIVIYCHQKNTFILQTEVYSVPECIFSNCLRYFLALKRMFM